MIIANNWLDYQIIATGDGQKLEVWGYYTLLRPDPQIIWPAPTPLNKYDACYERSAQGGGNWQVTNQKLPTSWQINYQDYVFNLKLMGFKHTGIFPEQAVNWDYYKTKIMNAKEPTKVLNLFAYTGAASVVALKAGASVVHVDSAKGMVEWAKANVQASNLSEAPIRYIVDDVIKFVKREIKRGNKYEVIIMDPPAFGRGSQGEVWSIEKDLFELVSLCTELLSEKAYLFNISSYATGISKTSIENILKQTVNQKCQGQISSDELGLPIKGSDLILPCGLYARWER